MKIYAVMKTTASDDYGFSTVQEEVFEMRFYRTLEKACKRIDEIYEYQNEGPTYGHDYEENKIEWLQKGRMPGYGFARTFDGYNGTVYERQVYRVKELEAE